MATSPLRQGVAARRASLGGGSPRLPLQEVPRSPLDAPPERSYKRRMFHPRIIARISVPAL